MEMLDKNLIMELATHTGENCLSIFIPTHRKGEEVNEGYDPIRLKNHLQNLRAELKQKQLIINQIEDLLQPIEELINDRGFWRYQSEGLAIFRDENIFKYFHSPLSFEEVSQVSDRFLIRPLFPFAQSLKPYYLLNIGKKGAQLYRADMYAITQVNTDEAFPSGIEDVTKYFDFEGELQGRTKGRGGQTAVYRSDDMDNKHKDHLLADYFRMVDEGIKKLIGTENAPLLLASVEYYQPIYRQVNSYPLLHAASLTGNFDHTQPDQLRQMANELLPSFFESSQSTKMGLYQQSSATKKTSTDIKKIVEAAASGRVDTVFVSQSAQDVWGSFDEQMLKAHIHRNNKQESIPLLEKAVYDTLQNGGEVYVLTNEQMPQGNEDLALASLFRY